MGKYSKRGSNKTKRRIKKYSKKRIKKTYRRKRLNKRFLKGGDDTVADSSPAQKPSKSDLLKEYEEIMKELDTFPLPEDPDDVVSRLSIGLYDELKKATTREKKTEIEEKLIALVMAKPLYIKEIMNSDQKNREKIKNAFTGLFKKAISLTTTAFTGPLGKIIVGGVSELLVRVTGKIYEHMDQKSVSMNSARSSAQEASTLEDHRVLMSLMVNMFMPNYEWVKKTLFLKLCRFWVMGGVLINDMWWARLPVDNPPGGRSDPRFKPSTAEKEFYDRLWLLCKTFIGLPGKDWNEMMKQIKTEMGPGNYELVMSKMQKTLGDDEDISSLKEMLGEEFVGELLGLASAELGGDVGDLFKDINEGITEGITSLKSRIPDVDISKFTEGAGVAKEFYDSVLATKKCSEEDALCVPGTKVKTKSGSLGTVVDPNSLSSTVETTLSKSTIPEPIIYVSFPAVAIHEDFHKEQNKNDDGNFVYAYKSDSLEKQDNIKEKAIEFLQTKIGDEDGGTGGTPTDDSSAGESTPHNDQ